MFHEGMVLGGHHASSFMRISDNFVSLTMRAPQSIFHALCSMHYVLCTMYTCLQHTAHANGAEEVFCQVVRSLPNLGRVLRTTLKSTTRQ